MMARLPFPCRIDLLGERPQFSRPAMRQARKTIIALYATILSRYEIILTAPIPLFNLGIGDNRVWHQGTSPSSAICFVEHSRL